MTKEKKASPQMDLDSVSKRLKYIVDTLGVKQSHMANKLGVSPAGLHYILNNDVKFSKNAKKIAGYLNINERWLKTGEGEIYEENTSIKTYKIPIFYPDQLKIYFKSGETKSIESSTYFISTTPYQNKTIAIYNTETSFSPKFELGDIIVFEQAQNYTDGEILLVYFHKTNQLQIKQGFHLSGDEIALFSLTETPTRASTQQDYIVVGCYRECLKKAN